MRQNSSKENLVHNKQVKDSSKINFPLAKNAGNLPSQQSMKIGIRKFEKNIQKQNKHQSKTMPKRSNTQSRACLQLHPESAQIINQVIQKRLKPHQTGPAVHTKDEYKMAAQIIHFALKNRQRHTQPLFTTSSSQSKRLRQNNSINGEQPYMRQTVNSNAKRGNRSTSGHRDQQHTIHSFGKPRGS